MSLRFLACAPVVASLALACGNPAMNADVVDVVQRDTADVPSPCGPVDPTVMCYLGLRNRACSNEQLFPPICVAGMWQCGGNTVAPDQCGCQAFGMVMAGVECPCASYGPPPNNVCPTDGGTDASGDASSPDAAPTDASGPEAGTPDAG